MPHAFTPCPPNRGKAIAAIAIDGSRVGVPYWRRPGVWDDVKASMDKFSGLNPKNPIDPNFIYLAYWSQQWDDLNKLLKQLDPITDNAPFGSQESFNKIVKAAEDHAAKK